MGAGKTSTLYEASDLLIERGIHHAAIDLDSLGVGHLDGAQLQDVALRNLAAVCANYTSRRRDATHCGRRRSNHAPSSNRFSRRSRQVPPSCVACGPGPK